MMKKIFIFSIALIFFININKWTFVFCDYKYPNPVKNLIGKATSYSEIKWTWSYDKKDESNIDGFLIYANWKLVTQIGEIPKNQRYYILDGLIPSKNYTLSICPYKMINGIPIKSKIIAHKVKTKDFFVTELLPNTIKAEIANKDTKWTWDLTYYNSILKRPEDYVVWFSADKYFNKKVVVPLVQGGYTEINSISKNYGSDYNIKRYFMLVNKSYNAKSKSSIKILYVPALAILKAPSICIDEIGIGYARIRITDNSINESGFNLYCKTKNGGNNFIANITSTSILEKDKDYYYTINDFNIANYYSFYSTSVDKIGNESSQSNITKVENMIDFSKENFLDDKKPYNVYEYTKDNLLYAIKDNGKWGYIKKDGENSYKIVIDPRFDESAQYFIGRYLAAKYTETKIENVEVIGKDGTFYIDEKKKKKTITQKWGYYYYDPSTQKLNIAMDFIFDEAKDFVEDYARVKIYNRWAFITNESGKNGKKFGDYVINPMFEDSKGFYGEALAPVKYNGKWGFIDKNGKFYINPKFEDAGFFSEGLAPVKHNGKWGYIDKNAKFIINPIYDGACKFSDGLAAVKSEGKWGFINENGSMSIGLKYEGVDWKGFSEGLAAVKLWGNWGYIDKSGKIIIEPQFDYVNYFIEGWAIVGLKDTTENTSNNINLNSYYYGIINKDGKYIWTPTK